MGNPPINAANGEMAARVRDFDWSKTPLGPFDAWPQSLRLAVGICLNSHFPMFVWWGPQLINLYNDSYAPILGKRHPSALGKPAQAVWSEIWEVIGPQADAVMQRGESTWNERVMLMMERSGYSEQTWFTWSYSPLYDETGGIGGLFCACIEETPKILVERERDRLLRENENEHLRLVEAFARSPSFMAILRGPHHEFEYVNERYRQLIGARELIGRPVREALPEVEGQGFFELLDRVYASGETFTGDAMRIFLKRQPDAAPQEAYVDFVYQPMRAPDGAVIGILAHGVDVTQRQQAQQRDRFLLELEDALRPLTDPEQITAACARILCEHLGADRCVYAEVEDDEQTATVTGSYSREVPPIAGRYRIANFGAHVQPLLRDGQSFVVRDVDTHQPALGDLSGYRQMLIRAAIGAPLLKGGRLVAVMAVHQSHARDWTDAQIDLVTHVASRCWESIQRARAERTVRESEADFRQLADAMPQIVFSARADGQVDYLNRQWYEYTGLPSDSAGSESWKQAHTEEGLRRVAEIWPQALRTGQPYEIEYLLRRFDGELRWHLGRALPIRDAQGAIVRWFGTNTDIHDRKQTEQALAAALDAEQHARSAAERASRMKDEFLSNLSHELRTPLNAILGWAHIMQQDSTAPAQLARGVEVIERNARAQAQIIEDLLDMSAIISGKVRLHVAERIDLTAVVTAAIETTRTAADAKHLTIDVELDAPERLGISADPSRLQQVIWNLLSNAIKFTPTGGRINVKVERVQQRIEIAVTDTGEGIEADFLPYVFDRFRQADASTTRRHSGLGLGLSIVKQLVELHGGTVRVHSEGKDKGTTFALTFPVDADHAPAQAHRRPSRKTDQGGADTASARLRGANLLVVDDDADARDLVRRLLEECGAQVTVAASSAEALEIIRLGAFDLLVSDIGMPGKDGLALMRSVRDLPPEQGGKLPAVALTAYARAEDRLKTLHAGYQMHLAKPVDPGELIATVGSLVNGGRVSGTRRLEKRIDLYLNVARLRA